MLRVLRDLREQATRHFAKNPMVIKQIQLSVLHVLDAMWLGILNNWLYVVDDDDSS